jgi:hypothetical protein
MCHLGSQYLSTLYYPLLICLWSQEYICILLHMDIRARMEEDPTEDQTLLVLYYNSRTPLCIDICPLKPYAIASTSIMMLSPSMLS